MGSFHFLWKSFGLPHMMENSPVGAFISLCADGVADRAALIRRGFADLTGAQPRLEDAADVLMALALTPAEHAAATGDRVRLVGPLLTVLLENDARKTIAASLEFLSALAPTAVENTRFTSEYMALLDRSSPVAGHAQEVLLGMDEAGLLDPETFTEMCQRVLLRPEKKLVRAQLADLDRAARRDPARTDRLVVDAATSFQHRDPALQERALDVIARHLGAAGGSVPPELRAAADWLTPFIGMHGLNSRKGVCRTRDDPLDELADVVITAVVAISGVTGDADEARSHFERRLASVTERAGL